MTDRSMQFDERNDKNDKNKNRPCENYMILLWWLRFVTVPRAMVQQLTMLHVLQLQWDAIFGGDRL